jgi:hypothetical protein
MTPYYVGLDVHSKQSVFVIEESEGKIVAQGEVATTPAGLQQLQKQYPLPTGTPVALNRTTRHSYTPMGSRSPLRLEEMLGRS